MTAKGRTGLNDAGVDLEAFARQHLADLRKQHLAVFVVVE